MSALFSDPIFIMLSVALLASIGYNIWQVIRRNQAWKQVMNDTNLKLEEHKSGAGRDQTLSGVYRHRNLILADSNLPVYRNGKRKSDMLTSASTNLHATLNNPQGYKLTLHRTTQVNHKAPIGHEDFDSRFNVTCEPERFASTLLASETLRQKLQELKPGAMIELKENELVYDNTGRLMDAGQILSLFDVMCSLAEAIESWRA